MDAWALISYHDPPSVEETRLTRPPSSPEEMRKLTAVILACVLAALHLLDASSLPITAPAFLWSTHDHGVSSQVNEFVNYRTLSTKDLAKTVLSEGGWSNFLCAGGNLQKSIDVAVVFVGKKLQSSDIAKSTHVEPHLIDLLRDSFTNSNFSMAFPYVSLPDEKEAVEKSLISEILQTCGDHSRVNNVALTDSCLVEGEGLRRLAGLPAAYDYIYSKLQSETKGQTDLILMCSGDSQSSKELDELSETAESEILSKLISFLGNTGASYTVLYTSNPHRSHYPPSHQTLTLQRFLAEAPGNKSVSSTSCDSVCQFTSTLLEGVIVGIVLLLILISGLLCMMGIDTPTRFEAPQES
ncbi:hypothetical protein H6P81_003057 [Aristolochia fimbriata]|uniref:V-type proton ATPase subunit S1/VOA1 transmembrane domain-containing protein n=1 Tax=Aristolochia fimbriata TaxID=158543 RepID=A0AAV7FC26_ARIFI|nr:hypothetical protein H6P81_003057 [Aristolochia fimbriata]